MPNDLYFRYMTHAGYRESDWLPATEQQKQQIKAETEVQKYIKCLDTAFTYEEIKKLLTKYWYDKNKIDRIHCIGFCYLASEALYYLCAKDFGYKPKVHKFKNGETHWFLCNKDGKILDSTSQQLRNSERKEAYKNAKFKGFLTKKPSKKCIILMSKVERIKRVNSYAN